MQSSFILALLGCVVVLLFLLLFVFSLVPSPRYGRQSSFIYANLLISCTSIETTGKTTVESQPRTTPRNTTSTTENSQRLPTTTSLTTQTILETSIPTCSETVLVLVTPIRTTIVLLGDRITLTSLSTNIQTLQASQGCLNSIQ